MLKSCGMEGSGNEAFEYWKAGSYNHKVCNMNFTLIWSLRMCTHGVKMKKKKNKCQSNEEL